MGNTAPGRRADAFPRNSVEGPENLEGIAQERGSLTGAFTEMSLQSGMLCAVAIDVKPGARGLFGPHCFVLATP